MKTNQERGLTKAEHDSRLQKYGPNQLTPPKTIPEWVKFLKNMTEFFSLLILAGGVLCIIGYILKKEVENLYLGIVLFAIVIITGTFTYFQEKKSNDLMASFKNMMPNRCTVTRDGNPTEVVAEDLVIGDIVHIKAGDKVPADIRILECSDDMQVDNACLTGESEPCKRSTKCTDANPLETQNMAFFGTQVPKGSCKGVVVATGDNTVMGHIAKLTLNTGNEKTPIRIELDRFISIISAIAITLGVLFFIIGVFLGTDLITNLVFMIGIIVANVPEGLLATITLSLSLTANRMSSKNVLVKNLQGVETLGSTSCICSDKTGTLTKGELSLAEILPSEGVSEEELLQTAAAAERHSNHPVARAILAACPAVPEDAAEVRELSGRGMSVFWRGRRVAAGRGDYLRSLSVPVPQVTAPGTQVFVAADGRYLGALVLRDTVKEDAAEAVKQLRALGVKKQVMLTGDSREAADPIAAQLGLDEALSQLLPEEKLSALEELRRQISRKGKLLYTGDGINDTPVLTAADVGVAMGGLGADAAIEAADVVLMGDEPSRLADGIRLARKTVAIANENIIFSIAVKVLIMTLAALHLVDLWLAVFADVGVCMITILNALRLNGRR